MFCRGDLKALAIIASVAVALLIVCLLCKLREKLMKTRILVVAMAAASLAMSGCASIVGAGLPKEDRLPVTKQFMDQYADRCDSHIWGGVGGIGTAPIGFDIQCKRPRDVDPSADAVKAVIREEVQRALQDFTAPPK